MLAENIDPNNFDDIPLSQLKGPAFEVPEEAAPAASDETSLPLAARVASIKPAVRKEAFTELSTLLGDASDDAPDFEEYAPRLIELLSDDAPLCHEGVLSVALAFAAKLTVSPAVGSRLPPSPGHPGDVYIHARRPRRTWPGRLAVLNRLTFALALRNTEYKAVQPSSRHRLLSVSLTAHATYSIATRSQ